MKRNATRAGFNHSTVKSAKIVCCPVCDARISSTLMNSHLEICLEREKTKALFTVRDDIPSTPQNVLKPQTVTQPRCEFQLLDTNPQSIAENDESTLMNSHLEYCFERETKKSLSTEQDDISMQLSTQRNQHNPQALTLREDRLPDKNTHVTADAPERPLVIQEVPNVPGLYLIEDFIDPAEEAAIIQQLDTDPTPWRYSSFNGHCLSKTFGVRTNLAEPRRVRPNDPAAGEMDIPPYLAAPPRRLRRLLATAPARLPAVLRAFDPNECNANSYETARGHFLTPHFDDRALSGPVLANLSLGCTALMTFHTGERDPPPAAGPAATAAAAAAAIDVRLPPRCLQLVTGTARYARRHSIRADAIAGPRRVSVTWRQAGNRAGPPVVAVPLPHPPPPAAAATVSP